MQGSLDREFSIALTTDEAARGLERAVSWNDDGERRTITVRIPAGVVHGTRLRMAGMGQVGEDGARGDLYLRLDVSPNPKLTSEVGPTYAAPPPAQRRRISRTESRLAGCFFLTLGLALTAWIEYTVQREGHYSVRLAFVGPFLVVLGVGMAIHAPQIPIRPGSRREGLYALAAAACGLANLHRYGAFDEASAVRLPVLIGLCAVSLYWLFQWTSRRSR